MTNTNAHHTGVRIRRLTGGDFTAVERLAQLDSATMPEGALLGVEIEGRLLAVTSLDTGATIADPFSRTSELRDLLAVRVKQLRRRDRTGKVGLRWRGRAALAGSTSNGRGRLLTLRPF